ncbi:antibiotic biosynthesis monooxygenase (plasmid) [Sphingomonas paeninsulae]|jgi:quinol monooxygenase YgiN|uniref:Antibiotic biosynthesis monooxygenase n=1 Tax=Sphingomonas paeninsulae TaxID=2319844 RepID=A0A494TJU9_SPHPE|nr:antibiotic biosynthesis monooxygenase [Sphingomonas paeninsulae]AYJ85405.1 antibiotic biosynthesis monooxygenase [Sphingomonas paeninsulae]
MIAIIATFTINAENAAAFEAVAGELVKATNANEPGVQLYKLVHNAKDPTQYRMMELYDDQAAVDAHMASEWFKAAGPKLGGLIEGRMQLERYAVID